MAIRAEPSDGFHGRTVAHTLERAVDAANRPFEGLAVRFVRAAGARIMLRGLRTTSDMEYEFTMSLTNLALDSELETVFLMARETYSHISGTLLRQIANFGGELDKFVPPTVKAALQARVRERRDEGHK